MTDQVSLEELIVNSPQTTVAADGSKEIGVHGFYEVIIGVVKSFVGPVTRERVDALIAQAEAAFEKYVVPRDIPGVGPIAELGVEAILRRAIRPTIEHVIEWCGVKVE